MPTIERDEHGFDAPAPLEHPGRADLPEGHPTGPKVGERTQGCSGAPLALGSRSERSIGFPIALSEL